jgi:hypothetical protein
MTYEPFILTHNKTARNDTTVITHSGSFKGTPDQLPVPGSETTKNCVFTNANSLRLPVTGL